MPAWEHGESADAQRAVEHKANRYASRWGYNRAQRGLDLEQPTRKKGLQSCSDSGGAEHRDRRFGAHANKEYRGEFGVVGMLSGDRSPAA